MVQYLYIATDHCVLCIAVPWKDPLVTAISYIFQLYDEDDDDDDSDPEADDYNASSDVSAYILSCLFVNSYMSDSCSLS